MRWVGIRFELDAAPGVVFVDLPYVFAGMREPTGAAGSFRLRIGRGVRFAPGVIFEVEPGADSVVEIGDGTRIGAGVHFHLRGGSVRIGDYGEIRDGCVFKTTGGSIELGKTVYFSYGATVQATERVVLGDLVGIGERSTLVDSGHVTDGSGEHWARQGLPVAPIHIERNTFFFANVVATLGTHVGPNCQVAAGTLLRGEYPGGVLIAGVPGEVVRELGDD